MSGQNFADRAAKRRNDQRGFTLIEMSIVLVIIGLIVGGVLKGQEVVNNARLKTQVAQIDAVKAAVFNFQDKFNDLPGDFSAKAAFLTPDFAAWDGDGNGAVAAGGATAVAGAAVAPAESLAVWPQLGLTNLVPGVSLDQTKTSWPLTGKITGSFLWFATWTVPITTPVTGNYVRIDGSSIGGAGPFVAVKNIDAQSLDLRYDDGIPETGSILANTGGNAPTTCYTNAGTASVYTVATSTNCVLFWGITQ